MRTNFFSHRILGALLCLSLVFGLCGPIDFTPSAEAATSAQKRKLRKLRKENRRLKGELAGVKRDLAIARIPLPTPPPPPTPAGMVLIPAGSFLMGDETNGNGGGIDELPVHTVTLSAFYIDRFEVTKALWNEVRSWGVLNGYSDLPLGGGLSLVHPVHTVSWFDAVKWCNARSQMEGLEPVYENGFAAVYQIGEIEPFIDLTANGFRLPTEAEWEKSARGKLSGNTYPWGNSVAGSDANFFESGDPFEPGADPETTPVGYYDGDQVPPGVNRANGYGLYDVAGNVVEWCWDWYSDSYYNSSPGTDPLGSLTGSTRVLRGGSWDRNSDRLRCAKRNSISPANRSAFRGFRCARGLTLPEVP